LRQLDVKCLNEIVDFFPFLWYTYIKSKREKVMKWGRAPRVDKLSSG
jgi:hypothetical protein